MKDAFDFHRLDEENGRGQKLNNVSRSNFRYSPP